LLAQPTVAAPVQIDYPETFLIGRIEVATGRCILDADEAAEDIERWLLVHSAAGSEKIRHIKLLLTCYLFEGFRWGWLAMISPKAITLNKSGRNKVQCQRRTLIYANDYRFAIQCMNNPTISLVS